MIPKCDSVRPFVWTWLIYIFLLLPLAAGSWISSGLYKTFDFRSIYSAAVLARMDPSHLYDLSRQKQVQDNLVGKSDQMLPYGHLAFDALLYVPLSLLNYRNAYLLVLLCNAILVALSFLAARKEFCETIPFWQPRPGLLFFPFIPTTIAVAQGQDALLMLLALCFGWTLLNRSREFAAGFILATLLIKPHLALLVALFTAVRYGRRVVAGFIAGAATISAICLPYWLNGGWRAWLGEISKVSLVSGNSQAQEAAVGVYSWAQPNLRGACLFLLGNVISPHVLFAVICLASLALLLWGLVVIRKLSARNAFAFCILMATLLSYHLEPDDLAILVLPMVLIGREGTKAIARCRDAVLALPIVLLIFSPSRPGGAEFAIMAAPILASSVVLSRITVRTPVETAESTSGA